MERRKVASSLIVFVLVMNLIPLLLIGWYPNTMSISEESNVIANDPHGPIAIDGDANFSATASAEGWSGDGSAQDPYIIENYDITLGSTPEACIGITNTRANYTIRGCNLIGPAATPSYGIHLENSTNGRITDNMITSFSQGVNVSGGSMNIVVAGNNISYNSDGIWWDASDVLVITQNLCSNNFFSGIYISGSDNGTISGNNCSGNGEYGIRMTGFSKYHTLSDNICNENTQCGIRLQGAIENVFENNTSNENDIGIWTTASNDNFIQWNIFANNTTNGITDGVPAIWDYNYWSDYTGSDANSDGFGDTSYTAFGDIDHSPLMFPPFPVEWVNTIADQQVEFGSDFLYSIAVSCDAPYEVWMNDSTNFFLDNEVITSRTALSIGDYPLSVNATNIYGYRAEADFVVRVRDTTPPTITEPDDLTYRVDDSGYEIQWTASDLSPLSFVILRNGTELSSSTTTAIAWHLSIIVEDLPPGVYNYTVVAVDTSGNTASDTVLVTILPIPILDMMLPWLIVGIIAVVVVISIVVILRKRKTSE